MVPRQWTQTAAACHAIKADCSQCSIPYLPLDSLKEIGGCQVYKSVAALLKKIGPPNDDGAGKPRQIYQIVRNYDPCDRFPKGRVFIQTLSLGSTDSAMVYFNRSQRPQLILRKMVPPDYQPKPKEVLVEAKHARKKALFVIIAERNPASE